jgi:gliding motility-associated-like protein
MRNFFLLLTFLTGFVSGVLSQAGFYGAVTANNSRGSAPTLTLTAPNTCSDVGNLKSGRIEVRNLSAANADNFIASQTCFTITNTNTNRNMWVQVTIPAGSGITGLYFYSSTAGVTPQPSSSTNLRTASLAVYNGATCTPSLNCGSTWDNAITDIRVTAPHIRGLGTERVDVVPGNTYRIEIFTTQFSTDPDYNFDVFVVPLGAVPANNDCTNAIPFTNEVACNLGAKAACYSDIPNCAFTIENSVFYSFIKPADGPFSIDITNVQCQGGGNNLQSAIYLASTFNCNTNLNNPIYQIDDHCFTGNYTYTINNSDPPGTEYIIWFDGDAGAACTWGIEVIAPCVLPTISSQPLNRPVCSTGSTTLSVTASAGPYQWQSSPDGVTWTNVVNGTPAGFSYSNATTNTLGISTTNAACAAFQYRCVVGNPGCTTISNAATVTVLRADRVAPTGPQCSGTQLNFTSCPAGATYSWSVTPPVGTSATPTSGSGQNFSFTPTNNTLTNQTFAVNTNVTFLGLTCPFSFTPTVVPPPQAGTISGNASICLPGTTALSSNGQTGGTWSTSDATVATVNASGLVTAVGTGSATISYTVNAVAPCVGNDVATFNVSVTAAPNAGSITGTASFCESGSVTFTSNGDTGGTWSTSNAAVATVNPITGLVTAIGPGTATISYTVAATSPCTVNDVATFNVTVSAAADAGTISGTASLCEGATTTFTSNGQTGGTWSTSDATVATVNASGLVTAVGAGSATISYTVNAVAPCVGNDVATFNVTIIDAPDAGTNGTLTVCAGTTPLESELFASLGGTPDAGGSWSNVGLVYTYTLNAVAPCTGSASSTVTVTEQTDPNAGTNGTLAICAGTTPSEAELFASLGGTPDIGGSWSNVGLVYTYTINAVAPCTGSSSATVTVTEQAQPNAGTNGTLTVCAGTTPSEAELFASLGGTPDVGGSWSNIGLIYIYTVVATSPCATPATATVTVTEQAQADAGTNGVLTVCAGITPSEAELFASLGGTPDVGGSWSNVGLVYTYTVSATAPCTSQATATVSVTEQSELDAGTNGTLAICAGTTPSEAELFTALNGTPQAGGIWSNVGLVYTYTINAVAPCTGSSSATVTVTEQAQPNAGTNGTLTVCAGTTPSEAELFASLGGTPDVGGSWSNIGLIYTYTVVATSPCATPATATVTVTEQAQADAGTNGVLTVCAGITPSEAELFASLGGTPDVGGSWSNVGLVYTYTVSATAPCTSPATATVSVTEQSELDAGTNGTLAICAGTTPSEAELFTALNGTPQAGGIWSNVGLVYTYTINAVAPCTGSSSATVTVTEQAQPNAGTNGTLTVCAGTTPSEAELFASLGGTPDVGGSWSNIGLIYTYTVVATSPCATPATATVTVTEQAQADAGTNGVLTVCAGITPSEAELFASLGGTPDVGGSWSNVGLVYTYTVSATAPCTSPATATVSVTEQSELDAGTNGTLAICAGTTPSEAELFTALNGTPQAGGIWSNVGLVYTYTINAVAPCTGSSSATVTVTEQAQPNAGTNGTLTVCAGTTPSEAELFASLGGTPDVGGSWSNIGLIYTYTVVATSPCATPATATVTVTEQAQADAGTNGVLTVCAGITPSEAELFASLGGTPDVGGSWSNVGLVYTYTVSATAPCTSPATATVSVTEQSELDAGTNGTLAICAGTTPSEAELFTALNGTPQAGGIWSNVGLVYTYTINAVAPCTGSSSATVTVTEQAQPNAGTNGTLTVCAGTTPSEAELFASLGGTPDVGGSWSNIGLIYTYTVVATSPCATPATATVTVTEQAQADAGTNGVLTVCAGITPSEAELFASLGGTPDVGGSWSNVGLVYTYTVSATAPCTSPATATVSVTEQSELDAGTNGTLAICAGTTPSEAELFTALNGTPQAGGIWSNVGLVYTYTVNAVAPCTGSSSSTVTVTEQAQPNAGMNGTLAVCAGTTPSEAELFAALNGTPQVGGAWSNVGLVYTYTVSATAPCTTPATATITVTEQAQPNAGTDVSIQICTGDLVSSNTLFLALGGTPDIGGTWSPQPSGSGVYTYTLAAVAPCTNPSSAIVTVTEESCDIVIPTGFTPGGDGVNDTWNIIGLDELYPLNYVIIFNRWGNEIFRSTEGSYSSMPWDGTYQGKLMPVGSYYYMILPYGDDTNKEDIINGTITIIKE